MADSNSLLDTVIFYRDNFVRNIKGSFTRLSPEKWIRIVLVVCTYLLIRPYLVKWGARYQERQHEKVQAAQAGSGTDVHPNELRTGKKLKTTKAENDKEEEEAKPAEWGKNAKARQRKAGKDIMEKEERRLLEEDLED